MDVRNVFKFRRQTKVAIIIQAEWRRHRAKAYYNKLKRVTIVSQCAWRSRVARRQLRKLKMAARETGALKEAKDKLEKCVEELSWHLQLETLLRTNLEESKAQDIAKLQASVQALQAQLDEANAMVVKEREEKRKAIEETLPLVQETHVLVEDTAKVDLLTKENEELKSIQSPVSALKDLAEMEETPQKTLHEKQKENQDALIKSIIEDVGFSEGRPVAACIIYKSLLQWRSFESERTSVFDYIIQTLCSAVETQENNDVLAYWLSNTSTLLLLLQRTLKASGAADITPQDFQTLPSGGLDASQHVEAKYPALLFKQQLTAYVEKIYRMINDNLKEEISPLLGMCIQAPRTSRASLMKVSSQSHANYVPAQALISQWQSIVKSLNSFLKALSANYVPPFLVRKIFKQIFSFINVQLFNSFLLCRECCSFSNGEFVKAGLAELEHWCYEATEEYVGAAWDELKHSRQAVGFLAIHEKEKKSLDEITYDLCPVLSIQQLYRISTMYWDDKYGTQCVSLDVISKMRVLMREDSNTALSNPLLLDDDSRQLPTCVSIAQASVNL